MNLALRVLQHLNFRTHKLVKVLFLKEYQVPYKGGALICEYSN